MNATRILLIDPTTPWITNSSVLKNQDQVMLPIGLMYLSSYLKERLGDRVEVRIVSTIVDLPEPDDLESLLAEFQPDVVGIRCVISENFADIFSPLAVRPRPVWSGSPTNFPENCSNPGEAMPD